MASLIFTRMRFITKIANHFSTSCASHIHLVSVVSANFSFTLLFKLFGFLPPATKLGQGYVFTGVCDSVNRGVVCLSACWDTLLWSRHPREQIPPQERDTPRSRHPLGADTTSPPPREQSMLGDTVNARAECNLVFFYKSSSFALLHH